MNNRIFIVGLIALYGSCAYVHGAITDRTFLIAPEQHRYIMELEPTARGKFIAQNKTVIEDFFKKNIPARLDDFRTIGPLDRSPTFPQYMRTRLVIID